ncbi:ABC transporter permease [Sphingobacterium chuzhouense]|uniref:ABC transporter permease n=1 Tax=Sphingobacterium chuzhouense TaxID=1742264 RepID=A0ABR7XWQ2_9SPHI|nr:ABC transporter permease [Sphingobacterium chuzhouense]MBD1423469.1 ABC transporter permease [Sphingobacterium chuzhouense]
MIKNYIKTAWRSLLKNKGFSTINIIGLAIGMTAVLLIALWVQNQFLYDNFYSNKENIYKLWNRTDKDNEIRVHDITMGAPAKALKAGYPEVEHAARMYWSSDDLFTYGKQRIKSKGNEVDPDFLNIFDFPVVQGTAGRMLDEPNNIVLTESLAKKLFGNENPMDKIVIMGINEPYKVSGVIKDLPSYTDFDFTYLIPFTREKLYGNDWNTNTYYTFVSLRHGTDVTVFNKKIQPLLQANAPENKWASIFLYPISKMHLYSHFKNGVPVGGKIEQVRLVGGIGLLILLIACINFMNLSTARSQKRSKEVAVRKVVGAPKKTLVSQFLFESILLAFLAGIIAIVLTIFFLPLFNTLLDKPLVVAWTNPMIWGTGLAFILITGFLAGVYPAFVLSAFQPIKTLKGIVHKSQRLFNLREGLVVVQFSIAVFLIVATLVIQLQVDFAGARETGYNVSQLIEIPTEGEMDKNYEAIKAELISNQLASHVTRTGWTITGDYASDAGHFSWEGATPEQESNSSFALARVESDFVETLRLTLLEGRDIDYAHLPADSMSVLLNQTAIKRMGLENPVGKYLKWGDDTYTIVGVIKDHIIGSPYKDIKPLLAYPSKHYLLNIVVRTNPQLPMAQNLQGIEKIIKKFNPAYPFSYKFVDEQYAQKFHEQEQMGTLAFVFSLLAIFISCLGLFGLASYITETRIKEIGIRKVLGASVTGISTMLSKDFIKLVLISLLLASPISWWAMNKWLDDYTYRINMQWWMLALAGGTAIIIALLTVSTQAIRAARTNPVNSLRDE